MKKSMSSLDIAAWIHSSAQRLVGVRIGNIYASTGEIIVFKLKGVGEELVVEPGRRIHFTRRKVRFGKLGPAAQVLRKHLRGRIISGVKQHGFERIVEFSFKPGGLRLVVELLPRGAALLLGEDGRIIYSTRYGEFRDRAVRRGEPYQPPPVRSRSPLELDAGTLLREASSAPDIVRGLIRGLGWPPELAEEALLRAGVDKNASPTSLGEKDAARILEEAAGILRESVSSPAPTIMYDDSRPVLVAPFKPSYLQGLRIRVYSSIDEALDEYFASIGESRMGGEETRLLKALEDARRSAETYAEEAEELRRLAGKASQHILVLEEKLECARRVRRESGWSRVVEECGVAEAEPSKGLITVEVEGERISLDVRLTAEKNILEMYRRAGELEAKARRAERILGSVEEKLEELRRKRRLEELREKIRSRPREWYEKYHWMISSEGFLVIGGRNIDQNESIVRRYLEDRDVFMHADIYGAPVVIIKTGGRKPGEATIREAAVLAASYSRAWAEGLAYVDVYWVFGEQVSKSPPPGEYLPKGSFMVYGKRNYVRGVPLRIALGVEEHGGYPRIIVGPEEPVSARSRLYVVLVPGSLKPAEAAERIVRSLVKIDPGYRDVLEAMGVGEIASRIPGSSRIIAARRGRIKPG